jgi:hypothetical protein
MGHDGGRLSATVIDDDDLGGFRRVRCGSLLNRGSPEFEVHPDRKGQDDDGDDGLTGRLDLNSHGSISF